MYVHREGGFLLILFFSETLDNFIQHVRLSVGIKVPGYVLMLVSDRVRV